MEMPIPIQINVMVQKDTTIGAFLSMETEYYQLTDSSFYGTDLHLQTSKEHMSIRNKNLMLKNKPTSLFQEIKFNGAIAANKNQLNGQLIRDGEVFEVELFREGKPIFRPQEPQKPFPYYSENVKFTNKKDSVVLSGTLTLPNKEGKFPAVILRGGSLPNNRDGESNFHRFFLVLSDHLTRHGIAVLRYDDRGIGKSTGDFWESTVDDFSEDLLAGYEFLASRKEIKNEEIGLIGHSEGGLVVSMAASQCNAIQFVVMLGGLGIPFRKNAAIQRELRYKCGDITKEGLDFQNRLNEKTFLLMDSHLSSKEIFDSLYSFKDEFMEIDSDSIPKNQKRITPLSLIFTNLLKRSTSPKNIYSLNIRPSEYFEKLTCPVLSLTGTNDMQVPAKVNQEAIRQALIKAGNTDYKIVEIEGLNHSFQECKTGSIKEALTLEQTFSPKALDIMTMWILDHVED